MVVVTGPTALLMGVPFPKSSYGHDVLHRRRIGRTFAISDQEITAEQFRRFFAGDDGNAPDSTETRLPATTRWYGAARYCNWLSEQEGLQPCYQMNARRQYAHGMRHAPDFLARNGYRLPTSAEWEMACRAGAATSRFYGTSGQLLDDYAWYAQERADQVPSRISLGSVGSLKPNDLGLFDVLGNAQEWTCWSRLYNFYMKNPVVEDNPATEPLDDAWVQAMRGGWFKRKPWDITASHIDLEAPQFVTEGFGFRVVRTLPLDARAILPSSLEVRTAPPIDAASGRVLNALEGEDLKTMNVSAGKVVVQDMLRFEHDKWSAGKQLYWRGAKPGGILDLELPVVGDSKYAISAVLTVAPDYAIVQLRLDGEPLDGQIDLFNGGDVLTTGVISFGERQMRAGNHRLTLEIVGANPSATPAYMVGLDYVRLEAKD
jgi:formylglycine-generating enzyme required for sulfatase activity